jgi:hypothetical protein
MRFKFYVLAILTIATVTACAHPLDVAASRRAADRQVRAETSATIAGGACDDVGQLIPNHNPETGQMVLEASAAPHRR